MAAEGLGPVGRGELSRLSLLAMPAVYCPEAATVCANGVVQARTDCSAAELFSVVRADGPAVANQLAAQEKAEIDLLDLMRHTERLLRLRYLTRDDMLGLEQARSGCHLLLKHATFLRQFLEGSSVRIASRNEMSLGRKVIDIAWDTQI